MGRQMTDADALIAVLAAERCWEMAERSRDCIIKDAWQRDGDAAWSRVQEWLGQTDRRAALAEKEKR